MIQHLEKLNKSMEDLVGVDLNNSPTPILTRIVSSSCNNDDSENPSSTTNNEGNNGIDDSEEKPGRYTVRFQLDEDEDDDIERCVDYNSNNNHWDDDVEDSEEIIDA